MLLASDTALIQVRLFLVLRGSMGHEICTPMFPAALFATAKMPKQPECALTDDYIQNMHFTHLCIMHYIYIYIKIFIPM